MEALVTVAYDCSRVVAGHFTWAAPLAARKGLPPSEYGA